MNHPSEIQIASRCGVPRQKLSGWSQARLAARILFTTSLLICLVATVGISRRALAQDLIEAANVIRVEHYAGLALLANGQSEEAFTAFQTAYSRSMQAGGGTPAETLPGTGVASSGRSVDSIPPLVMMGECLYYLGDVGGAVEHFDAAMRISVERSGWLGNLKFPPPARRLASDRSEARGPRELLWGGPNSRSANAWSGVRIFETVSTPSSGEPRSIGMQSIDAVEILRCQAIALRRRHQLLGPLLKFNSVTTLLPTPFAVALPESAPEVIRVGAAACYELANLGTVPPSQMSVQLRRHLSLSSGHDHPLTSVLLLTMADLAIQANHLEVAEELGLEASLTAARAGQSSQLEEGLEIWSMSAFQNQRENARVQSVLQQAGQWAQTRSRLVGLRVMIERIRQASFLLDRATVTEQTLAANALLVLPGFEFPRLEAVIPYAQARLSFAENDLVSGAQLLDESLLFLRGSGSMRTASAPLYQMRSVLSWLSEDLLNGSDGLALISELLDGERIGLWRTYVLDELALQTGDRITPRKLASELAMGATNPHLQIQHWERWKHERVRRGTRLNGRYDDLRVAAHGRFVQSASGEKTVIQRELERMVPPLMGSALAMRDSVSRIAQSPKWDMRRWTDEERRRFDALHSMAKLQEGQIWLAAISPLYLPPPTGMRWFAAELFSSVAPDDSVLAFYSLGGEIRGYLLQPNRTESWKVDSTDLWSSRVRNLQSSLSSSFPNTPDTFASELEELRRRWVPDEIWEELQLSRRWIVVPDGLLWDFPFEMLPLSGTGGTVRSGVYLPALAKHRVCYAPTLSSLPQLLQAKHVPNPSRLVVSNSRFWNGDLPVPKSQSDRLNALFRSGAKSVLSFMDALPADTTPGSQLPPASYTKMVSGHYISAIPTRWNDPERFQIVAATPPSNGTAGAWNSLPFGTPNSIWLLGHHFDHLVVENSVEPGDEWLRWSQSLISQGTSHILISRWHVGGTSTLTFTEQLLDSMVDSTFTEALQRSAAAIWSDVFPLNEEPIARSALAQSTAPAGTSLSEAAGAHPLFWASYMSIGDPGPQAGQ